MALVGGGSIFTEAELIVKRTNKVRAKVFVVDYEYAVFDQHGQQVGGAGPVGKSARRKVLEVFVSDQLLTHELHRDLAWSYPDPIPENPRIAGLVALFNERVDLVVDGERLRRPFTPWSLDVRA